MGYYDWKPYVPVARRRARAEREMKQLARQGKTVEPVVIEGRKIALSFWGAAWCEHLEKLSDFENRLPRGRTYVRNGSVCHLGIGAGRIEAVVSGSEPYQVEIDIDPLPKASWERLRELCTGKIGSALELLQGRLSQEVMRIVTDRDRGLFPKPGEIRMRCGCPDWAGLCKHLAAVLYGVGARLDQRPELLFQLRGVDPQELIGAGLDVTRAAEGAGQRRRLADADLAGLFGIAIDERPPPRPAATGNAAVLGAKAARDEAEGAPFTPSGPAVAALRRRLGLNKSQFAYLLGVSGPTVSNWEAKEGPLNLQSVTLQALRRVADLSAEQAAAELRSRKRRGPRN